ncbi:protein maelstrom homolog [Microplitis mediator]|uniref:protein maelstrom homolog n=1 Tax=Microplitis mediator TaxID=375433 RepID=UPI00255781CE|nr:protein maelstrom homolog [Microplitis mediator]
MPKKTQRNGFYYFMLDFKRREEKKGNKFNDLREIQDNPKCDQEWKALSVEEKKKYNDKAKKDKAGAAEKRTGLGESVKLLEKQQIEQQKYEIMMKEYIDCNIDQAYNFNQLDHMSFYFIHVNWYYTKTDRNNVVDYIPAEFSVIEFSLSDGIKRCYQEIIKIVVETGYTRENLEHSEATHKITACNQGETSDYKDLYNKFFDFISSGDRSIKKLPPLYTSRKMKTVVPCLFERMTAAADTSRETFDLFSLEYLFGTLMLRLNEEFPESGNRASLAEAELEKDAFVWTPNIECAYHSQVGSGRYCSQSIVTQWAFTFCDYCCPLLRIKMINGKHCPNNNDDESLTASMHSMRIKEDKASTLKSSTGVSESHRQQVSSRTRQENEERKKQGRALTIIDYSEIEEEKTSIIVPSASVSASNSRGKQQPLRYPISLSEVFTDHCTDSPPKVDDDNYPAIGALKSKSRSKK